MAIQIRRGTKAGWDSNKSNIVAGEPAIATDTEQVFVGTGSGTYVELASTDYVDSKTSGGGITDEAKQALLACFENVAWINDEGQTYVDALEIALYPPASLTSISAVYTQSGTVYDTDSLDSLKTDLVVTAIYDDSSTSVVSTYTLSGSLQAGTSTITVSYGGKTTTFTVTVTHDANIYVLTENDFSRSTALMSETPYYRTNSTGPQRLSYIAFDLLLDGGKTYKITADSTYDTANIGYQFFNQTALTAVNNNQNIPSANILDPGWQSLTNTYAVPAAINNSPVAGVRFTFRQSSSSPVLSDDFKITRLAIEEVE